MVSLADSKRSVIVAIDFQGRLMEMVYRHEDLVANVERLLRIGALLGVPVVVTEQYPQGLGPTVPALQSVLEEIDTEVRKVEKVTFSCCGGPGFFDVLDALRPPGDRQIVVVGIEAQICVVQTVLELLARGEQVLVCAECVTGRGPEARQWALERMRQAGAQVVSTESVAFEWTRSKEHPQFKQVSSLLKGVSLP